MRPVAAALFAVVIHLWLLIGKPIRTWWFNRLRPEAPVDLEKATFPTLEEYAAWLAAHTEWQPDPLGGLWDVYPSLGHLFWQLETRGKVTDDCDGLAYFAAATVKSYCDPATEPYVVSVTLNPFEVGLQLAVHAVCFFRHEGRWRCISNGWLEPGAWTTFADAIRHNSYCEGRQVVGWEVRDADLRRVRDVPA